METPIQRRRSGSRFIAGMWRPWRAVEELDGLSDEECGRLVAELGCSARWQRAEVRAGWVGGVAAAAVLGVGLAGLLAIEPRGAAGGVLWYAAAAALVVASGVAWGVGRGWAMGRALRREVRGRLRGERCACCGEAMGHLPTRPDGAVHCARCGRRYMDPARLRTAEQLILCDPDRHRERLAALPPRAGGRRCSCGYPLKDLPARGVRAVCPECGEGHTVMPGELEI